MSNMIPFEFEAHQVRVIDLDGAPWFVAKDVCEVLGIGNPSQAITRLDDDEVTLISTEGNHRKTNFVNESGLYALIFTSRKKAAQRFRKWVTGEVLPTLRRTGSFVVGGSRSAPDDSLDPVDVTPANRKLVAVWTNCMREVRLTFGEKAARDFYSLSPLPKATGHVSSGAELMAQEGENCLHHLLSAGFNRRGDVPVWTLIEHAPQVPAFDKCLRDGGVLVNPSGFEGFVAFSLGHPRLERVFALTDWAHDWRTPLLTVRGVTVENVGFQKTKKTRAVLIPLFVVRNLEL